MSLWEDLGDFLGAAKEATAGAVAMSWDLATLPVTANPFLGDRDAAREDLKSDARNLWNRTSEVGTTGARVGGTWLGELLSVPGIKQAAEAQYWTYSNVVSQPLTTAILAGAPGSDQWGNPVEAWKQAENISPGQAMMANSNASVASGFLYDSLFTDDMKRVADEQFPWMNPEFDITSEADRKDAFEESWFGKVSSGALDTTVSWYGDPFRGAGKLASKGYRSVAEQAVRGQGDLVKMADDIAAHDEWLASGGTAGKRTGLGKFIEDSVNMSPSQLLFDKRIKSSSRPELLASLLGESTDYKTNALILRAASGDAGAWSALREADIATWDQISSYRNGMEATQSRILEKLGGRENLIDKDGNIILDWDYDSLPGLADDIDLYQEYKRIHDGLIEKDAWLAKVIQAAEQPSVTSLRTKGYIASTVRGSAATARADRKLTKSGLWRDTTVGGNLGRRAVRVISWLGDESPSGWVNIKGASANGSAREIVAALSKVRSWGDEAGALKKQYWTDRYINATTQQERMQVLLEMEKDVLYDIGRRHLGDNDEVKRFIDKVYDQHGRARTRAAQHLSQRSFMVDSDGTLIKAPQFEAQLADSVPLADFHLYEDLLGRHNSTFRRAIGHGRDAAHETYDIFASIWRPLTLLRLGYTMRNVGENQLRSMAFFEGMANVDPIILSRNSTAFRMLANASDRTSSLVNRVKTAGQRHQVVAEAEVLQANRSNLRRQLDSLVEDEAVMTRTYKTARGPAAMRRDDYYAGMTDPLQPELQPRQVKYTDVELGVASASKSTLGARERTRYFELKEKGEVITSAERAELAALSRKATARWANEQKKAGYRLAYRDADGTMKYADKVSDIPDSAFDPALSARAQRKLDDRNVRRVSKDQEPAREPLLEPEVYLVPRHSRLVKEAQDRTEVVPAQVLEDYPRLAKTNPEDEYIYQYSANRIAERDAIEREIDLLDGQLEVLKLKAQYLAHGRRRKGTPQDADMIRYRPPRKVERAAEGYRAKTGIGDPVNVNLQEVVVDDRRAAEMVKAYDDAVEVRPEIVEAWKAGDRNPAGATPYELEVLDSYQALADETLEQYRYLTEDLGIQVEFVVDDPYPDALAMVADLRKGRLKVFATGTEESGQHPFLTNAENDMFRAVHDAFGHAAVGRAFDRHGEDAAWLKHSSMFSEKAARAMTTETRGQNSWFNYKNPTKKEFPPQKLALMDRKFSNPAEVTLDRSGSRIRRGGEGELYIGGYTVPDSYAGDGATAARASASANPRGQFEVFGPNSHLMKKYDSMGAWVRVNPAEGDVYWDALARVVNRQFRNSETVMRLLKGEDPRDVASWLARSKEGRQLLKAAGVEADDALLHVRRINDMIERYVPDPTMRLRMIDEDLAPLELKTAMGGRADLAPIHGQEAARELSTGTAIGRAWNKATQRGFHWLGTLPEDVASRHPFYRRAYQGELNRTITLRIEQGVPLTQADLDNLVKAAHQRALKELKETLYTIERFSNAAAGVRFLMPFFASWENSMRTWMGLAKRNGSVAPSLLLATQAPNRLGWVTDINGNPVGVGEDAEGGEYLTVQLGNLPLPGWMKEGLDSSSQMLIPKGSLNLVMQGDPWYAPGFGPIGQIPMSEIAKRKPEVGDILQKYKLLPFGPSEKFMSWDLTLPASVKRLQSRLQGESDVTFANQMAQIMATERIRWRNGERDTEPTMDEILARTRRLFEVRTIANLTLPFSPTFETPYAFYFDEYRRIRNEDPENADAIFLERYPEYYEAMMSMSKNPTGAWATADAVERTKKYGSLVAGLGELDPSLIALVTNNGAYDPEDFSDSAYAYQYTHTLGPGSTQAFRERQSPVDAVKAVDIKRGWTEYMKMYNLVQAQLESRGLESLQQSGAEDLAFVMSQYRDYQRDANPAWWYDYNERDAAQYASVVQGLESIVSDETFMADNGDDPKWAAVQAYLDARAYWSEELRRRDFAGGSADINAESNADLKYAWDQYVGQLNASSTEFGDIYVRYLENDTLGAVPQ